MSRETATRSGSVVALLHAAHMEIVQRLRTSSPDHHGADGDQVGDDSGRKD